MCDEKHDPPTPTPAESALKIAVQWIKMKYDLLSSAHDAMRERNLALEKEAQSLREEIEKLRPK